MLLDPAKARPVLAAAQVAPLVPLLTNTPWPATEA